MELVSVGVLERHETDAPTLSADIARDVAQLIASGHTCVLVTAENLQAALADDDVGIAQFIKPIKNAGLELIMEVDTTSCGSEPKDQASKFTEFLNEFIMYKPKAIVATVGSNMWSKSGKTKFYQDIIKIHAATDPSIDLFCSNKASTALYHPWEAESILDSSPLNFGINVDFGQWCCAAALSVDDLTANLKWQGLLMKLRMHKVLITAGIGSCESARVLHPADKIFSRELNHHELWWRQVWASMRQCKLPSALVLHDFTMNEGRRAPFTKRALFLQSEVARWMIERVRTAFTSKDWPPTKSLASTAGAKMSKKQERRQYSYVSNTRPPPVDNVVNLDISDCKSTASKTQMVEQSIKNLKSMVSRLLAPQREAVQEWSSSGLDFGPVPLRDIARLRGRRTFDVQDIENDERVALHEDEDDAESHEEPAMPGTVGIELLTYPDNQLVQRLVYRSLDNDTTKMIADRLKLNAEELHRNNLDLIKGLKKRSKLRPGTFVVLLSTDRELDLQKLNRSAHTAKVSSRKLRSAKAIWIDCVSRAKVDAKVETDNIAEHDSILGMAMAQYIAEIEEAAVAVKGELASASALAAEEKRLAVEKMRRLAAERAQAKAKAMKEAIEISRACLAKQVESANGTKFEGNPKKRKHIDISNQTEPSPVQRQKLHTSPGDSAEDCPEQKTQESVEEEGKSIESSEGSDDDETPMIIYETREDDSLAMIARECKTTADVLLDMNKKRIKGITKRSKFRAGTLIFAPVTQDEKPTRDASNEGRGGD